MAESLFLSDGVSPYIATTIPPSDGEIAQWSDSLNAWTNSTAPAGSGNVTASGTLTNNVVIVGGGTTVVKATTSPALGTPSATKLGIGVTTPEVGSLLQVKESGAGTVTGGPGIISVSLKDESTFYAFGLVNTTFSTVQDDGLLLTQSDAGLVHFYSGNASLVIDPAGRIYTDGTPLGTGIDPDDLGATAFASYREIDDGQASQTVNVIQLDVSQTDLTHADGFNNLALVTNYGVGGVASKGAVCALNSILTIEGCGDADDEPSIEFAKFSINIGTGFTQSSGPTPRMWFKDWQVQGPIAVKPELLNGVTLRMQNNYNGSPNDGTSAAMWLLAGGGIGDALHQAATSYPMDVALGIVGVNSAGAAGFTTGIQIGGTGDPWGFASSVIGTGLNIRDYTTAGININNADAVTAPSIIFDTFLQTAEMASAPSAPSANGVRIYAVDSGGGKTQLYALFASGAAQLLAAQP